MKIIGLLGGMSWESTVGYYRAINEGVKASLGGLHSAKVAMYSVDFDAIEKLQHEGDWEGTAKILVKAALNVQQAGADFLLTYPNHLKIQGSASRERVSTKALIEENGCSIVDINNAGGDPLSPCPQGAKLENQFSVATLDKGITITYVLRLDLISQLNSEIASSSGLGICPNTMHKVAPQIEAAIDIPLLHIADATAEALVNKGVRTVGLLGTAFTMEQEFYKGRLKENYGLTVLTPDKTDREIVHNVIYQELCLGNTTPAAKAEYLRIIKSLAEQGAEAVILGCTEIGMLVNQSDTETPLLDTTYIHAQKAVERALLHEKDNRIK